MLFALNVKSFKAEFKLTNSVYNKDKDKLPRQKSQHKDRSSTHKGIGIYHLV